MSEKIVMEMNRETASIVKNAMEFYSRVICGQFEEIAEAINTNQLEKVYSEQGEQAMHDQFSELIDRRDDGYEVLKKARKTFFPELHPMAHYGVGYSRLTDIAWNVYATIRHAMAWHDHPEGGKTVDFYPPLEVKGHESPVVRIED